MDQTETAESIVNPGVQQWAENSTISTAALKTGNQLMISLGNGESSRYSKKIKTNEKLAILQISFMGYFLIMSKNFFVVEANPQNKNFHSIYVEAENEELARQLFCEYYSIPTSHRKDDICKAQQIEVSDIPAGHKVIEEGVISTTKTDIRNA